MHEIREAAQSSVRQEDHKRRGDSEGSGQTHVSFDEGFDRYLE